MKTQNAQPKPRAPAQLSAAQRGPQCTHSSSKNSGGNQPSYRTRPKSNRPKTCTRPVCTRAQREAAAAAQGKLAQAATSGLPKRPTRAPRAEARRRTLLVVDLDQRLRFAAALLK